MMGSTITLGSKPKGPLVLTGAGGGAAVFAPTDIANILFWWDFSAISTLFTDLARTTPVVADADRIGGVTDKSGLGNHAGNATAGSRFTYKTNQKNGLSVGRSDGVDDFLGLVLTQAQPLTIVAVCKFTTSTASGTDRSFISGQTVDFLYENGTDAKFAYYAGTVRTDGAGDANWHVWTIQMNGASSIMRKDAVDVTPVGSPGAGGFTTFSIGGHTSSNFKDADMGEVLLYSGALSLANIQALETYANAKWAVY